MSKTTKQLEQDYYTARYAAARDADAARVASADAAADAAAYAAADAADAAADAVWVASDAAYTLWQDALKKEKLDEKL